MYKVRRPYSLEFTRSLLAHIHEGRYTPKQAARVHGVDFSSVYKWLKLYGTAEPEARSMSMADDKDRIEELERQKKALERALAQAKVKIILLETTVEVLEERYGNRSKKKTDRLSSSESEQIDSLHYEIENKMWALIKSREQKRKAGDWIDRVTEPEYELDSPERRGKPATP